MLEAVIVLRSSALRIVFDDRARVAWPLTWGGVSAEASPVPFRHGVSGWLRVDFAIPTAST